MTARQVPGRPRAVGLQCSRTVLYASVRTYGTVRVRRGTVLVLFVHVRPDLRRLACHARVPPCPAAANDHSAPVPLAAACRADYAERRSVVCLFAPMWSAPMCGLRRCVVCAGLCVCRRWSLWSHQSKKRDNFAPVDQFLKSAKTGEPTYASATTLCAHSAACMHACAHAHMCTYARTQHRLQSSCTSVRCSVLPQSVGMWLLSGRSSGGVRTSAWTKHPAALQIAGSLTE